MNPNNTNAPAGLFNGNVAYMITDIKALMQFNGGNILSGAQAMVDQYDQLHRIKRSISAATTISGGSENWDFTLGENRYETSYDFDGNGNITNLKRSYKGELIDNIDYIYNTSGSQVLNNRLLTIKDKASMNNTAIGYYNDIANTGTSTDNSSAYSYDAMGNLKSESEKYIQLSNPSNPYSSQDVKTGYTNIEWTNTGKVAKVFYNNGDNTNREDIEFTYDAFDNRLTKKVETTLSIGNLNYEKYIYQKDANGNTLAVYREVETIEGGKTYRQVYLEELSIYGVGRIGQFNFETSRLISSVEVFSDGSLGFHNLSTYETKTNRKRGEKQYELSNHLGNVLAVISDKVSGIHTQGISEADYYQANVVAASDYLPYGWVMPGRQVSSTNYRYGYNGQEEDKEWRGGQAVSFKYRIHDPRLGRFLSIDPLASDYPWYTPYQFAGNKVIWKAEREGLETKDTKVGADCEDCRRITIIVEKRVVVPNHKKDYVITDIEGGEHTISGYDIVYKEVGKIYIDVETVRDKGKNKIYSNDDNWILTGKAFKGDGSYIKNVNLDVSVDVGDERANGKEMETQRLTLELGVSQSSENTGAISLGYGIAGAEINVASTKTRNDAITVHYTFLEYKNSSNAVSANVQSSSSNKPRSIKIKNKYYRISFKDEDFTKFETDDKKNQEIPEKEEK
jgi:RHS repeat-associated protein